MFYLITIFVFIFGLCIGSFLNCIIYRLEKNQSFVKGRSYCPHCKHTLMWSDLIPVASFLLLKGKCRYCSKKISPQYPIIEIATGLLFLVIFNKFGLILLNTSSNFQGLMDLVFLLYISSVLMIIFVYDLRHYIIPDKVLFPAIAIAFIYHLLTFTSVWNYLLAALLASGFFLSIYLISKGNWMGFGDVKLAILLGLILGFPNILLGLFLSFFFGAIIGIGLICLNPFIHSKRAKIGLKSEIPFAPFLIVGTLIAIFFGNQIIQWYLHFLYII